MTKNKEKSAIDAIYTVLEHVEKIEKRLVVIDNNIKLLNNKINKLNTVGAKQEVNDSPRAIAPITIVQSKKKSGPIENVKVFGRIKNKQEKPIKDVDVRIYDEKGKSVKSRKTDSKGYWEARIPPGDYGIEYDPSSINKRLRPVNFKVKVSEGIKELDISEINK